MGLEKIGGAWRACALAALFSVAAVTGAAAQPWTSQDGRLSLEVPNGWPVDLMSRAGDTVLSVATGTASNECQFWVVNNPATAAGTPEQVIRAFTTPFTQAQWDQIISTNSYVRGGMVAAYAVDTSGFWPRQTAEVMMGATTVYASLQGRPGYDIYGFCKTYDGPDTPTVYAAVLASAGSVTDAATQATVEAERAARAAASAAQAPAAAPAPAEEQPTTRRRRN